MPATGQTALHKTSPTAAARCWAAIGLLAMMLASSGCALLPDIKRKPQTINPFPQLKTIAILPFANQSEDPTLSGERVALAYLNELQAIRGFEVLPLGAVKQRMAGYQGNLASGEDFQAFAQYLGVDAVLIGSVTDYDSYYPPRMSLKVNWYAANPSFHPVEVGYGLPWGTKEEKNIPKWIHNEAQRALAVEQLKTQTPLTPGDIPLMPEDRAAMEESGATSPQGSNGAIVIQADGQWSDSGGAPLPPDWPDPRGFIPDPPSVNRPQMMAQHAPIISHMRNFNGHDEDFTEQLADYFYFRDDTRFGGWQAYLQRSEDFIRFCCHLHLQETLVSRGGQDKSRLIFRWPLDRYTR
ncbi:MAG: hypothetical protein R3C09_26005 [Pirellulaceae bacterium]